MANENDSMNDPSRTRVTEPIPVPPDSQQRSQADSQQPTQNESQQGSQGGLSGTEDIVTRVSDLPASDSDVPTAYSETPQSQTASHAGASAVRSDARPSAVGSHQNFPTTNNDASVQAAASAYEQAVSQSTAVDLGHFLPPRDDPMRSAILMELVRIDLAARWQKGERVLLEDYLKKFPELGSIDDLPARLIHAEYRARHGAHGDRPPLPEYEKRFPGQYTELSQFVEDEVQTIVPATGPQETAHVSQAPVPAPPPGGWESNGYKMIKAFDRGGFGEIWRAEARGGIPAVVKIVTKPIDHADAQRELKSLELIKTLRHHFLMTVNAFWTSEDRLLIAMNLADGNLRGRLRQCRREGQKGIPPLELLNYMLESAEALDYLHDSQIQHRDVKPENILLVDNHVRVADFGLAYRYQLDRLMTSGLAGSLPYMSPEACEGKVGAQSDQYSLAVTYVVLRLDRNPYGKPESLRDWLRAHCDNEPDLEGLSEAEAVVVRKGLAKDPKDRYPNCVAFAKALEGVLRPLPVRILQASKWPLIAGAIMMVLMPAAYGIYRVTRPPPDIRIVPPVGMAMNAGETRTIKLGVNRDYFEGPLPLKVRTSDESTLKVGQVPAEVPRGDTLFEIPLNVADQATEGKTATIDVQAGPATASFDVRILRFLTLPPNSVVKPGENPIVTAANGARYFTWVSLPLYDGSLIDFRLIPRDRGTGQPFYITTEKVSNGLFRKFDNLRSAGKIILTAAQAPQTPEAGVVQPWGLIATVLERGTKWELGGEPDRVPTGSKGKPLGADNPRDPVLRVTAVEADTLARWLGCLLPSGTQWEAAAGEIEVSEGMTSFYDRWRTLLPGQQTKMGIRRTGYGPMSLDADTIDVSDPYGCKHMHGNGTEWTNTMVRPEAQTLRHVIDTGEDLDDTAVLLRGQTYLASAPFKFTDEKRMRPTLEASHDIGFRLVLPSPRDSKTIQAARAGQ